MEQAELDDELTELEELRQGFDALTLIANRQVETIKALLATNTIGEGVVGHLVETIKAQRAEMEHLKGGWYTYHENW